MANADLTAVRLRELLHYDPETGLFTSLRSGRQVGFIVPPKGYLRVSVDGRQWLAHRLAWLYLHSEWPANQIDHINGVKTDNRAKNLRCVTPAQNMQNIMVAKSYNKTSGLLGVTRCNSGKKWIAQISVNNVTQRIGVYDDPQEAHQAYIAAKRRLHEGCTI